MTGMTGPSSAGAGITARVASSRLRVGRLTRAGQAITLT